MDRLEILVDKVCNRIREIAPKAVIRVTRDTIEDEDIDVRVYTSSDLVPKVNDATVKMAVDILAEEGYQHLGASDDEGGVEEGSSNAVRDGFLMEGTETDSGTQCTDQADRAVGNGAFAEWE